MFVPATLLHVPTSVARFMDLMTHNLDLRNINDNNSIVVFQIRGVGRDFMKVLSLPGITDVSLYTPSEQVYF